MVFETTLKQQYIIINDSENSTYLFNSDIMTTVNKKQFCKILGIIETGSLNMREGSSGLITIKSTKDCK